MKAILVGRRVVLLLAFIVGLALWFFSDVNNALNYTEVVANVDRIEEVCRPVGELIENATSARCSAASASPQGKWWRQPAVYVRYQSPADGQQHSGVVIPIGGQAAVDASKLHPGDRWNILAHDHKPQDIKAK